MKTHTCFVLSFSEFFSYKARRMSAFFNSKSSQVPWPESSSSINFKNLNSNLKTYVFCFWNTKKLSSSKLLLRRFKVNCAITRRVFYRLSILIIRTCCSRLLAVTDRRGTDCSQAQTLSSLLASSITGLVWMPNLLTVIAELSSTAFSSTCKFGTAGTSKRNHSISWMIKRGKRVLLTEVFFIYRPKLKRAVRIAEATRKAVDTRSCQHRFLTTSIFHMHIAATEDYDCTETLWSTQHFVLSNLLMASSGTESTESADCSTEKLKLRKQRWFRKMGEQNQKRCSSNYEKVTGSEVSQALWACLSGIVSVTQDDPYHRSISCYSQGSWPAALQQFLFCWLFLAWTLFKLSKYQNNRVFYKIKVSPLF